MCLTTTTWSPTGMERNLEPRLGSPHGPVRCWGQNVDGEGAIEREGMRLMAGPTHGFLSSVSLPCQRPICYV